MANGVNVTDKGMQFLVSIDGSEAMSQLRELQSSMKGLASEIEKSVGLTQKTFNKTFDSLGELVKELDKNPGVGIPGAASKDAVKFSQKLNQELEKQRKKMNEGFVQARQGVSDLNKETNMFNNSVENLGDDIGDVNEKLSDMIGFGPQLKGMFAGLVAAFGIEALFEKTVELDEQLFQVGQSFNKTKDVIFDASMKSAEAVNSTASAINGLLAVSAQAGNNNLELASSFAELSTKMGAVFGVDAGKAQSALESFRQKGLATTEESAKSLGDSFVVIRQQFGTSFDQMAESFSRNSEALSKMRENMIKLGKDPEVAEDAVRNLGNQLLVIENTFRKVGGVSNGVAQNLTKALSNITIEPLNISFNQFKHILGKVDGDVQGLYDGLSNLAKGDATGMVKMLDKLDEQTHDLVLSMPADHLQKLFGGSQDDVKALIGGIQRMKEGGTSLTKEMEAYNKRMAEAKERGEILDRVWNEWRETVGGALGAIYTKFVRLFQVISNVVREPLADFLNGIDAILEGVDWVGKKVGKIIDEVTGDFKGLGATIKGLGAAIAAAFSLAVISKFADKLGHIIKRIPGASMLTKGLGMGAQTVPGSGGTMRDHQSGVSKTSPDRGATFREKVGMNLRGGARRGGVIGAAITGIQAIGSIRSAYEKEGEFGEETKQAAISGGASVAGGIAGGALGSAFGPIGTMIGAQLGASLGEWAANYDWAAFGESMSKVAANVYAVFESLFIDPFIDFLKKQKAGFKAFGEGIKNTLKSVVDWLVEAIQKIPGFETAMAATSAVVGAAGSVIDFFAGGSDEGTPESPPESPPTPAPTPASRRAGALGMPDSGSSGPMRRGMPVPPPSPRPNNAPEPQGSGSSENGQSMAPDNDAIVAALDKIAQGQEQQTQTMSQIAVSQANSTRVGGNPSPSMTQLNNIGNGAN